MELAVVLSSLKILSPLLMTFGQQYLSRRQEADAFVAALERAVERVYTTLSVDRRETFADLVYRLTTLEGELLTTAALTICCTYNS